MVIWPYIKLYDQGNIFQLWNSWEVWPPHTAATLQQNAGRGLPSHSTAKGQRTADAYSQLPSLWCVRWGNLKWLEISKRNEIKKVADDLWCLPACFSELFVCSLHKLNTCFTNCILMTQLYMWCYMLSFKIFLKCIYRFNLYILWTDVHVVICFPQVLKAG